MKWNKFLVPVPVWAEFGPVQSQLVFSYIGLSRTISNYLKIFWIQNLESWVWHFQPSLFDIFSCKYAFYMSAQRIYFHFDLFWCSMTWFNRHQNVLIFKNVWNSKMSEIQKFLKCPMGMRRGGNHNLNIVPKFYVVFWEKDIPFLASLLNNNSKTCNLNNGNQAWLMVLTSIKS